MADKAENNECPVCHELYRTPKLLPCYHRACRDCIVSWLRKGGQGGCPLCRAPILSPAPPAHLESQVDALPTDFLTLSLVEGHQVLQGHHACSMCPSNTAASSYCFECAVKLCTTCSSYHKKLPGTKGHSLQDVSTLTAQDLSAHFRCRCQNHSGTHAEVYCSSHQELLCLLCATTHHRSCLDVKAIAVVAREKRKELSQLVQTWISKETALAKQLQSRKVIFTQQRKRVKKVFDDLQQQLEKRRQELYDIIQKQEDDDAEQEKLRATVSSHTVTMEQVLRSTADGVVLHMTKQLEPRTKEVGGKCGMVDNMNAVQKLDLGSRKIAAVKSALSALGMTVAAPATSTTSTTTTTTTSSSSSNTPTTTSDPVADVSGTEGVVTTGANSSPAPSTPKPTGPALAKLLKVGDRVKATASYVQRCRHRKDPGPGRVTAIPSRLATQIGLNPRSCMDVRWDNGGDSCCRMGYDNEYWLELL